MSWVTPKEWGSKPRRPQDIVAMKLPAKNLYFHHTVTPVTTDAKKDTRTVEQSVYIKYIAIPYSGLIHPDGTILQGRYKDGHPALGAHTAGHNSDGLGLAAIGNYETTRPSEALIQGMIEAGRAWIKSGDLDPNFKGIPHSDVYKTACCGKYLKEKIPYIVEQIKKGGTIIPPSTGGVTVVNFKKYDASVSTDKDGNGYVDVWHDLGKDPTIVLSEVNGGIDKGGYPQIGDPTLMTASYEGKRVRVTVVGAKPGVGFGVKVLLGY
jgi:hypothetical protein